MENCETVWDIFYELMVPNRNLKGVFPSYKVMTYDQDMPSLSIGGGPAELALQYLPSLFLHSSTQTPTIHSSGWDQLQFPVQYVAAWEKP